MSAESSAAPLLLTAAGAATGGGLAFKALVAALVVAWLALVTWFLRNPHALEELVLSKPLGYVVVIGPVALGVMGFFEDAAALGKMGLFFGAVFLGILCLLVHVQLTTSRRSDGTIEKVGRSIDKVMDLLPAALRSARVQKIGTVDELFSTLNRARSTATNIRLMQLRDTPPVEVDADGNVRLGPDGRPIYHNRQEPCVRWYEGMREWCVQEGHQAERITNIDTAAQRSYADFVDADIPTGWTTIRIDRGRPLPFVNLCVFDSDRVLLTVELGGAHAYKTMTGLWVEDEGVAQWLVTHYYEKLKVFAGDA